jgi:23S rRNA A2030 N6-methylase RlmJ
MVMDTHLDNGRRRVSNDISPRNREKIQRGIMINIEEYVNLQRDLEDFLIRFKQLTPEEKEALKPYIHELRVEVLKLRDELKRQREILAGGES